MLKSLICFIGLCSFVHATNIDVIEVPQGREMTVDPTSIVISADSSTKKQVIDFLKDPKAPWSTHLFIGLDGGITCFVPSDAQLEIADKFSSKAEDAREMRDKVKGISDDDYAGLADYLMRGCYATGLCGEKSGWEGKMGCNNFSINIMLERIPDESNKQLEVKDGYTDEDLYQDYQIDVVHNILNALINKGISKKNILGLSDIALSTVHIAPYTPFWRQFYARHDGFFNVPKFSTAYKIKDANELENALLKIGYTNPIDSKTHAKLIGEDCWVRRAVNAFILHYLPKEKFKFNGLDRDVLTAEVAYDERSTAFDESILKFLNDNKEILDNITKDGKCSADNLDELSDALVELGYEKEEGERRKEMIARAVNNVSQHLFGYPTYHQHTFIYPPEGTCYSKELTYNILRDKYPEILSAIEQISNL